MSQSSDYLELHQIIRRVVHTFLTGDERPYRPMRLSQPPTSRHPSAAERRGQVARCRALRIEIGNFEADFKRTNRTDRLPRSAGERFPIAHVYEEYRGLKAAIRDDAARHIQAVYRGHRVRARGAEGRRPRAPSGGPSGASSGVSLGARGLEGRPSVAVGALPTPAAVHLANLRDEKAQLKRQLRAFDTEYADKHSGRQPSKADKEHLRPLYTRYHALKALIEEAEAAAGVGGRSPPSAEKAPAAPPASRAAAAPGPLAGQQQQQPRAPSSNATSTTVARRLSLGSEGGVSTVSDTEGSGVGGKEEEGLSAGGLDSGLEDGGGSSSGGGVGVRSGGGGGGAVAAGVSPELVAEKKTLQAYLRAFEREFEGKNGRKVKYVKDIESVKEKYARYKVLKGVVGGGASTATALGASIGGK